MLVVSAGHGGGVARMGQTEQDAQRTESRPTLPAQSEWCCSALLNQPVSTTCFLKDWSSLDVLIIKGIFPQQDKTSGMFGVKNRLIFLGIGPVGPGPVSPEGG